MQSLRHSTQQIAYSAFYMLSLVFTVVLFVSTYSHGSTVSDEKLKDIAREASIQMAGVDIGNGIVGRRVTAIGRTLMFQYDVVEDWQPFDGARNALISALKESGRGDFYFKQSVNLKYVYFKKESAPITVTINPQEFSPVTFELSDYISIRGHPKSKGINFKIQPPKDWLVEEGNGPNTVTKFTYKGNTFSVMTKEAPTFFSKSEARKEFSDFDGLFSDDLLGECGRLSGRMISNSLVTIASYPAVEAEYVCLQEIAGVKFELFTVSWMIFFEDKVVMLMGMGGNEVEFQELKKLYSLVAVTSSFPERFN